VTGWALGKIVIDCGTGNCTQVPWQDPVTIIAVPFWQSTWMLVICAILVFVLVVAIGMVRFRRQERLEAESTSDNQVEIAKANRKTAACPTCGTVYVPEKVQA